MARAASDKKVGEPYWRSGNHTDVGPGCFQISCSVRPTPNKRGELPKSLDKYVQVLISMQKPHRQSPAFVFVALQLAEDFQRALLDAYTK